MNSRILSVGLSYPESSYTQDFLVSYFSLQNKKAEIFFRHGHVSSRRLLLPPKDSRTGTAIEESHGALTEKFRVAALNCGRKAIEEALRGRVDIRDIGMLTCVTSSGFIVPTLSVLLSEALGFSRSCRRLDIVGMGCHAGLNGLNSVYTNALANPGSYALLVCVEICSAMYSIDDSPRTGIVNSLFGDGVAACLFGPGASSNIYPNILSWESEMIPEYKHALRYDWDDVKHRYSFYIDRETPAILAENFPKPLSRLLERAGLSLADIRHWMVHSGGAAILDRIELKLGLSKNAFRHTRSVLRDFGNVSSGSYLFSLQRLAEEKVARVGDYGVIAAMGPGLSIEMALVQW